MLLKKSVFFSLILLLVPISVYPSSENQSAPSRDSPSPSFFPTESERDELVKTFLSSYKKSAPKNLIKNIVELTNRYTTAQVAEILIDIMSTSKESTLEQPICIDKLEEAINRIDTDQIKQQKLAQLKEMACELFKPIPFDPDWLKRDVKPYEADPVFPTADERLKIVKEVLLEHKKFASESLMQKVVEQTSGCDESCCRNWVTSIVEISKSSAFKQERYLERPTSDERRGAVEEVLLLAEKSAPESLIEDIVELTDHYNIHTLRKLVRSMVKKSKTDSLDRNSCIEKLRKAINLFDEDEVKKIKFTQIKAIISRESLSKVDDEQEGIITKKSLPKTGDEQEAITSSKQGKKHPLVVNDIYLPSISKILITDVVEQLTKGKLIDGSSRGMLFYGPPGVGKTAMVEAMVNESGCHIIRKEAQHLVGSLLGSGSERTHLLFSKAREKATETGRSVIILIDELQELAPGTTDKNVGLSYRHSGQEHRGALAQIWTEYDDCLRENDNIFLICTCNDFELIDKRIRDRLNSIEFSDPDIKGIIEILRSKSKYYGIPLSESELKEYAKKMEGFSGRELKEFFDKAEGFIRSGKSNAEALALAAVAQSTAEDNARPKEQSKKSFWGKAWDVTWDIGEYAIKQVILSSINKAILGTNSSHSTSNVDTPRAVKNPALEAMIREQNRRRGE